MTGVPTYITDLFTTAASNSPAGSDSIGTSLDDYLRAIQGIMRTESENKGWERWNDMPTCTGNTTFTVATDLTARYVATRRIKMIDSSTLYGVIASASFGAGVTTVTVTMDSGAMSASLTEVQLGVDVKAYIPPINRLLAANNLSDVLSAATARGNLSAAKSGTNSDITGLTGLTNANILNNGSNQLVLANDTGIACENLAQNAFVPISALNAVSAQQCTILSQFTGSVGASGYYKLPAGAGGAALIIQWVVGALTSVGTATNVSATTNWPLTFPNACLFAIASLSAATAQALDSTLISFSATNSVVNLANTSGVNIYAASPVIIGIGN